VESFKPQKNYKNKIIVITGAAHGIGFSLAQRYAACKAKVVVLDVSEKSLATAKQAIPNAHFFQCDITDRKKVYQIAQEIEKNIGIPDYVFNNAGVVENSTFLDCPDEKLELTMNVNIMGQFWIAKAFLPMMKKKGGHLCQVASAAGLMGVSGLVA
jgi:all-trans-retinol dehydrogenase (NAD+)